MVEMNVAGLRRSGNHAILDWMFKCMGGGVLFNDVTLQDREQTSHQRYYPGGTRCRTDVIYSFEDKDLCDVPGTSVFVLRSYYNMMASRIHSFGRAKAWRRLGLGHRLWPDYARAPRDCAILFDKWLADPDYRQDRAAWLDIPYKEPEFVQKRSSFGDQGDLTKRWQQVEFPSWVLGSEEHRDLNYLIFGWTLDSKGSLLS